MIVLSAGTPVAMASRRSPEVADFAVAPAYIARSDEFVGTQLTRTCMPETWTSRYPVHDMGTESGQAVIHPIHASRCLG
jgi:hypothetical protein